MKLLLVGTLALLLAPCSQNRGDEIAACAKWPCEPGYVPYYEKNACGSLCYCVPTVHREQNYP